MLFPFLFHSIIQAPEDFPEHFNSDSENFNHTIPRRFQDQMAQNSSTSSDGNFNLFDSIACLFSHYLSWYRVIIYI